jgi:hypothetical protein
MMNLLSNVVDTTAPAAEAAQELFFEPWNFVEMLRYMGIGMLVIFVVIGVIMLCTMAISRMGSGK